MVIDCDMCMLRRKRNKVARLGHTTSPQWDSSLLYVVAGAIRRLQHIGNMHTHLGLRGTRWQQLEYTW